MAGEDEEIGIQRRHVGRDMRNRLRAVDGNAHPKTMGDLHQLLNRRDGTQRVRNVGRGDKAGFIVEQPDIFLNDQLTVLINRRNADRRARFLGNKLPRYNIGDAQATSG